MGKSYTHGERKARGKNDAEIRRARKMTRHGDGGEDK